LAQGLSAGGEASVAAIYLVEWAPAGKRGLFGSAMPVGSAAGLLLGTLTVAVLNSLLRPETMGAWGWRTPFLIGGLLAPVGFLIRRAAGETPAYERARANAVQMPKATLSVRRVLQAVLFDMLWAVGFYFFLSYMPTYAQRELHFGPAAVFWISALGVAFHIATLPLCGGWSDRLGRRPVLLASCVGFAALLLPLFTALTRSPTLISFAATTLVCGFLLSLYPGPAPAAMSEIFPTQSRSSGMTLGYNIATLMFGGFTPFIATWLIAARHTPLAPIYYVMAIAVLAAIFILTLRETAWDAFG
jgi:MFS transporter, MHS family, proline/betaine transporter